MAGRPVAAGGGVAQAPRPTALPWLGWVLFVVYGSLVPLDYHPLPLDEALARFARIPFLQLGVESRADWVANGVLYLPVGALLAQWLLGTLPRVLRGLALPLAIAAGAALAVGVEFAQLYFPPRTVSQNDLIAELLGTLLGALAAPLLRPWAARWRSGWQAGGQALRRHGLPALALGVLVLSFFPYDLLLDLAEWQAKFDSGLCGAWLAEATRERGWRAALLLGAEGLLALPFGLLLGRGQRRVPWVAAVLAGLLLGLLIEGGQLALASGVSQGASVLSRLAGVLLGAWCGVRGGRLLARARRFARARAWWLRAAHALLVLAASGGFDHAWRTPDQMAAQWAGLHLLPFYYHYYTTEAHALFSLGSVALLYAPLALIGWAARSPLALDLWLAGVLAGAIEAAKLGLVGLHPDPTNVLVALAVAGLLRRALGRAVRRQAVAGAPRPPAAGPWPDAAGAGRPDAAPTWPPGAAQAVRPGAVESVQPRAAQDLPPAPAAAVRPGAAPRPGAAAVALLGLALALAQALAFPAAGPALAGLLLAGAAAVVWRPASVLLLLPAALPLLDLAPWSGRLLWNEWDLLCLAWLPLAWWRSPVPAPRTGPGRLYAGRLVAALWAASFAVALLRGGWPVAWPDANAWFSQHQPSNALRIGRGALWAAALLCLLPRLPVAPAQRLRRLGAGLLLGLAWTVAVVLWERAAFVGLADFAAPYRVTGPFSAMHTGGATIEYFLATATVVAMASLLAARRWPLRLALLALVLGATYALMVTYSRNGWLALGAGALVLALAGALRRGGGRVARLAGLALALLLGAVAWPVLQGGFAQQRLAQTGQELGVRLAHWRDALALRDEGWATALLGQGLGRFPELHLWRSAEPRRAAVFGLQREASGAFLRLGAGAPVYVEQFVDAGPGQRLQLTLRLRAPAGATVAVALCEKWLLSSAQCARVAPPALRPAGPAAAGWQLATWDLDTRGWQAAQPGLPRPVKLALYHGGGSGSVDVAELRLSAPDGRALLANGDFAQGLDRWFYTTDLDPPWHIHSLPVTVAFDQGALGLLAWGLAFALALWRSAAALRRGDAQAAALLAALVVLAVSGAVNSLVDEPRVLWGVCLLLGLAAGGRAHPAGPPAAGDAPRAPRMRGRSRGGVVARVSPGGGPQAE